jgi:hypothetical protein
MFLYNTFQWPWTRIAALIAPRPMLFVNSDADRIFPMDANQRVINRLERIYSLYGKSDLVDSVVSIGGHAYREDIRKAAYRFINMHLKNDPRAITDSEVDLVTGSGNDRRHPIEPERLRVFPADSDIPTDELNTTIDRHFVPTAKLEQPDKDEYESWKVAIVRELRRVTFRYFPERIGPAKLLEQLKRDDARLESEPGVEVRLRRTGESDSNANPKRVWMVVGSAQSREGDLRWIRTERWPGDHVYVCTPRGIDETAWTCKDPPNYVERSHVLLGRTVDTGRIWDIIAAARYLRGKYGADVPVHVFGQGAAGVLAAYAGLLEPDISMVVVYDLPCSHMDAGAPPLLNVLRVCDIGDILHILHAIDSKLRLYIRPQ